jgi:hypothetical protein
MKDKAAQALRSYSTVDCTRRAFLLSALLGMIAGNTSACRHSLPRNHYGQPTDTEWLSAVITNPEAAARIGSSYLFGNPDQSNAGMLLKSIEKAVYEQEEILPRDTDTQQYIDALRRRIRSEYVHDKVVLVAGWVISTTEAHLYALVSLTVEAPAPLAHNGGQHHGRYV